MTNKIIHSDLTIPPGEFLEEVIDDLGMSKEEFAVRMNRPGAKLSQIFSGKKAITPDTALQIEKVTGVPAHIWTGLESEYRLALAKNKELEELEKLKEETHLTTRYCYADLAKLGFVKKLTKPVDKVRELQNFFGVTSLGNLSEVKRYAVLYRQQKRGKEKVSPEAVSAWLRIGEIKGQSIECAPFSLEKAKKLVDVIKQLSLLKEKNLSSTLVEKFAEAGIALVIVPHLPKTYAHGAAFWLKDKPVIMITIRLKWTDIFWFSLLHELAHIILHGKGSVFIESNKEKYNDEQKEKEADLFASDNLINPSEYHAFKKQKSFYKDDILTFAKIMRVHPGIIVGRLQHDELIDKSWHNDLRSRFVWSEK